MPLIWRGMGIIVPIIFFISAWAVSYWYDKGEAILGNGSYIGWSAMFASIALTLVGLGMLGAKTEDEDGQTVKKKHDFFYIPVVIWGLLLGGLSLYLLVFSAKAATTDEDPSIENSSPVPDAPPATRTVHFYNPTDDTLTYIVADETAEGLVSREKVAPKSSRSLELKPRTYLFSAFNREKETTLSMPAKDFASDESKFTRHTDDQGDFYQRILKPATKETDDYDAAWLVLNGKQDLLLIDIAAVCKDDIEPSEVNDMNWEEEIRERYDARDLIEPLYNQYMKDKQIKLVFMGEKLPSRFPENEAWFLLMPDGKTGDLNAEIADAVAKARFP